MNKQSINKIIERRGSVRLVSGSVMLNIQSAFFEIHNLKR